MSESAEVRASDRISQSFADVSDQPPATPSWVPYVTSVFAILCMAVTAGWGAFLVWGAIWLMRR
jgi:hypothetical protein